jgi:hypothetical protein
MDVHTRFFEDDSWVVGRISVAMGREQIEITNPWKCGGFKTSWRVEREVETMGNVMVQNII